MCSLLNLKKSSITDHSKKQGILYRLSGKKYTCLFAKLFHDPYIFSFLSLHPMPQFPSIALFRRTALFQHSFFFWREHSSSLLAFNRDPDVNGLGNPTLLYLFSHIEFIKQQMARDNVQFVRFESIDLHGVSRSKNVPSRFFQVSFLVSIRTFICFHAPILKLYFFHIAGRNSSLEQITCSLPLLMLPKELDFHHCYNLFLFSSKY